MYNRLQCDWICIAE